MADLKNVSCPNCHQKYRLPDSIENRKVVCRGCQFAFSVPGVAANSPNGQTVADESEGDVDRGMFDSLDVDDLLNAKSSGLSQRRPDPVSATDDSDNAHVERGQQPKPERAEAPSSKELKDRKSNSSQQAEENSAVRGEGQFGDATATQQPSALPNIALERSRKKSGRKKKRKKKRKPDNASVDIEEGAESSYAQSELPDDTAQSFEPIDPEEQAVFDYARAVNGRKNAFAMLVALAIAFGLGGWFAVEEIGRLKVPLTGMEREILEDEGFRLKAVRAPREGHFNALGDDVLRVGVAPGVRLDRLGQPLPADGIQNEFDPNAAFGDQGKRRGKQLKPAKKERRVDFDTRVVANEKTNSFTVGQRKVLGPALAVSPRNVVFVPEGDGIASYDLKTKKQVGYKTVGRLAGKSDKVVALATTLDARFMVAGFASGRVKLFQLDSRGAFYEITRLPQKHFRPVVRIAVSPDSQLIATVDADAQVSVWSVSTGANNWKRKIELRQDGPDHQDCLDLAFSSDGRELLAAMTDSDVVMNAGDGNAVIRKVRPPRKSAVLSPIDRSSISCTETEIRGFALEGDVELWKKSFLKSRAPAVSLGFGGTAGLFSDGNRSIIKFNLQTGELLGRLASVDGAGHQIDSKPTISADGRYLVSGSKNYANGKLRINHVNRSEADTSDLPDLPPTLELPRRNVPELWGTKDGKPFRKRTGVSLPESGGKISAVTLNDDGLLFYSTDSGGLYVYDWPNGIMVEELLLDKSNRISALASCGKWLAAGRKSGDILLYEVLPSGVLKSHGGVFGHDRAVVGIRPMPRKVNQEDKDSDSIVSVSSDGNLRVWEIPTRGSLLNVQTLREAPKGLVVLDDRTILVASTSQLSTVNPDTQKVSVEGSRRGGKRVALSPDGKKLAFVNGRAITIAKARTGVTEKPVLLDENPGAIQFTRNSRMLQVVFSKHLAIVNYRSGKTVDTIDTEIRAHSELETLFAISSEETLMAAVAKRGQRIVILPVGK